jgi:fibronectin type 3 domain-containing protein
MSFGVAFTPQSSGTVSGSLSLSSTASNAQATEPLTGVGTQTAYTVGLSWNPSSAAVGYNVYRSTSSTGSYSKINSALDNNTAYADSTVAAGNTYYYAATSVNSSGTESSLSTPVQVAVP